MGLHIFGIWGVRIFSEDDLRYKNESKVRALYSF